MTWPSGSLLRTLGCLALEVPQATMMRCGLLLNGVGIVVITALATWVFV